MLKTLPFRSKKGLRHCMGLLWHMNVRAGADAMFPTLSCCMQSSLQKQIRSTRTSIQQHVVQLLRERLTTHQSVSHGAAPADLGLDQTARQVLTALKKGVI